MRRSGLKGLLVLTLLLLFQSAAASSGSINGKAQQPAGACRKQLSRFYSMVCELRFADAQRYIDSLMHAVEADTSWHAEYLVSSASSLLLYVERREGAGLDSLERLYEKSARHPCRWAYGWLGMVLSSEYSRNANPAVALMYARASVQALREQGDSVLMQRAQCLVQLSCWRLGDFATLQALLDSSARLVPCASTVERTWQGAMVNAMRGEWRLAEMFLDTLRVAYYEEGDRLHAGYVGQLMATLSLRQHAPQRALSVLRWVDSLPSQRTQADRVFASWYLYGRCYAALGDHSKAIESYTRARIDADRVHGQLYEAEVLTRLGDAYSATGASQRAYTLKRAAVELHDSVSSNLSVKLFQSADNLRALQERMLLYEQQLEQEKHNEALRSRRNEAILVLLAFAIIFVEVLLYRLGGVLAEKRKQRLELQSLTDSLQQRGVALSEQGERLERLHEEGLRQTNRLFRIHASMRSRAAKIMQSMDYASLIQHGLLPMEQERNALFADSFLITRALQAVSGDLFWLGSCEGQTVAAMVDCTGYGVSGASLSFIAYMLLNSVVKERGVVEPAEVLKEVEAELRHLMQGADRRFQGEEDIELSVLTIDPAERVARFSGEGRQLFYSLDGRDVQCLTEQAFSICDSASRGMPTPTVTIQYRAGAQFYLMTDGFVQQLNADGEKLGMQRIASTIERVLTQPMREQRQELLGLFARHRLAQDQTDDITICGMRLD